MSQHHPDQHRKPQSSNHEIVQPQRVSTYTQQLHGWNTLQSGYSITSSSSVPGITNNVAIISLTAPIFDRNSTMALVELLSKDSRFGSLIAEKVAEQWEKTLKENAPFLIGQGSCRVVADSEADLEIRSYIAKAKESGKTRVDLLEIVYELGLPSDQIERVMEGLSKEGVKNESLC